MARIAYEVNTDGSGNVTITSTVQRIDPGDEIVIVTNTPNAALKWNTISPFAPPAADKIYVLPLVSVPPEPLQVVKSTDLSQPVAQCGVQDANGNFAGWGQSATKDSSGNPTAWGPGTGFPSTSTTNQM